MPNAIEIENKITFHIHFMNSYMIKLGVYVDLTGCQLGLEELIVLKINPRTTFPTEVKYEQNYLQSHHIMQLLSLNDQAVGNFSSCLLKHKK